MDIQKIKEIALANGFSLKEQASGNMDLHSYVYEFANAIEQATKAQAAEKIEALQNAVIFADECRKEWHESYMKLRKDKAVPEGFVLVEKSKVRTWYQDDDEPENFCNSESDLDCLGDCLDDDDIIIVNIHESVHISTKKVFGVWKSNSPTDIQSKFMLVDSRVEAEQIVTANKAMIEAQEQNNG